MGEELGDFASKAFGTFSEAEKKLKDTIDPDKNGLSSGIGGVSKILLDRINTMLGVISPFVKVQDAAIDLAKTIGLAGKSIMSNSQNLIEQNRKMQLSRSYGISTEEMLKLEKGVMMGLGRNVQIEQVGTATAENPNFDSAIENVIAANQVFGAENVAAIIAGYDKLGISMKTAAKATGKLYKEAGQYGINLTKYTENFTSNLQMAQRYNFRNGINGLKEMARKATEIRQDMSQIASFADKVGSVTGAVETAANLQVLGGSFASLANPLTMLNKSLTDVNGLQNIFNGMTEGAAIYNSVTHEIEMDPVTRQIMKRAAESMGVDPNNFIDQAYAQARRLEIDRQIDGVGNIKDEVRKLLPNIGEIDSETGLAGATIDGEFKTLAEIAGNEELQNRLIEVNTSESDDIKSIAKSVMGIHQLMAGAQHQMENGMAYNATKEGSVKGVSMYNTAFDFITSGITEETIEAARKLDGVLQDLSMHVKNFEAGAINELIKAFNDFGDSGAFSKSMGGAMANIFGESARGLGEAAGGVFGKFANTMDSKLKEYGFSPMSWFKDEAGNGREGRPEGAGQPSASVALAASDVTVQAANFSFNGGESTQIKPIEGNEPARAAAAVQGSTAQAPVESAGQSTNLEPVNPIGSNGQTGVQFYVSPTTTPSMSVAPTENGAQSSANQQGGGTRQGGNASQSTVNVSGSIMVNVNGDNGKIGTADIMKLLEQNSDFRRELAVALANAYAKLDSSGLVSN